MSTALTAFTTTHRVIVGVHNDTAVVGTTAEPAAATGLTGSFQSMVAVAYAADSGLAGTEDLTCLARGELDDTIAAFAGSELCEITGGTHQQSALTGTELDIVDNSTDRNVLQGEGVAYLRHSLGTRHHGLTDLQSIRSNNITFLTVSVEEQSDASRAVRIVLNGLHDCGNTIFLSFEVDKAIFLLVAAAHIADSHLTDIVTAASRALAVDERFLRYRSSNLFEGTYNFVSLARSCGL